MSDFSINIKKQSAQDDFFMCENCGATSRTSSIFLLIENELVRCYCEKHIVKHFEEYIQELVKGEGVEE